MKTETFYADRIPSPLGDLWAVVDADGALVKLDFEGGRSAPADEHDLEEGVHTQVLRNPSAIRSRMARNAGRAPDTRPSATARALPMRTSFGGK